MMTDCLARDRRLAVVGLKPGYEPDYRASPPSTRWPAWGGSCSASAWRPGASTCSCGAKAGCASARELPTDTLYRIVAATQLAEAGADDPEVPGLADLVKRTCRHILRAVKRATCSRWTGYRAGVPAVLADQVASALMPTPAVRQALLEETRRRAAAPATARGALHPAQPAGEGGRACGGPRGAAPRPRPAGAVARPPPPSPGDGSASASATCPSRRWRRSPRRTACARASAR